MDFSKNQNDILEDVLNEEILSYIESGYSINDEYVIELRAILKKLNIKEKYNFNNFK